jgi:hypothetical protein
VHNDEQRPIVEICEKNSLLQITVKFKEASGESIKSSLERSPLWETLRVLLPVVTTNVDEAVLSVGVPTVTRGNSRIATLEGWWRFHLKGAFGMVTNDAISTMLHDIKNAILGFDSASNFANSRPSKAERYQMAADASRHIEQFQLFMLLEALLDRRSRLKFSQLAFSDSLSL